MAEASNVTIVDPGTGDVFADEALDFDIINGTLRIRFGVAKPSAPSMPAEQQLVHVGRLIMPIQSAQRLCLALYDFLKKSSLDPSEIVQDGRPAN